MAYAVVACGDKLKLTTGDREGMARKIEEECHELCEALRSNDHKAIVDELGDVLLCALRVSFHLCIDLDPTLAATCAKVNRRFSRMVSIMDRMGLKPQFMSKDQALQIYKKAKETT